MLGKVPAAGSGFRGIVNYLVRGKLGHAQPERVAWSETRNLIIDDPDLAPRIMRSTASRSTRCEKPVYHFVVSWHKDENPTQDLMRAVGDTTLEDLELTDHQALFIAHHDTDHKHLHVVVNRVHPETGKAWELWKDWIRIEKSLGRQAKQHGLIYVPGRHNDPDKFRDTPIRPRSPEYRRAERLGIKEQLRPRWTKEQIAEKRAALAPTFEQARSWTELARALAQDGLTLERKGQGIVIGDDTGTMKLSDLKKEIRLGSLEQRFGESWETYEKHRDEPEPTPALPPQSSDDDQTAPPPQTVAKPVLPSTLDHPVSASGKRAQTTAEDANESSLALPVLREQAKPGVSLTGESAAKPPKPGARPPSAKPDPTQFAAKWKKRAADIEAKRAEEDRQKADDKRKKEEEAKAKEEAALERRRLRQAEDQAAQAAVRITPDQQKPSQPALEKAVLSSTPEPTPEIKSRQSAQETKNQASAEADLAYKLHQGGFITRKQLARAVRDRDRAQEEMDKHASGREKLKRELREALTPDTHKPAAKPKAALPPKSKGGKDEPER